MSIAPVEAATVSKTRLQDGDLYATVDGEEEVIERGATGAWIIEDGQAVIFATVANSEFAKGFLTRYNPNAKSSSDTFKLLMEGPILPENLRVVKGTSGKSALLVSGTVDGTGGPCVALVDPKRGRVWHQMNARATGLRNGRLVISVYEREGGIDLKEKPIKTFYPTIDELLSRTANPTP